METLEEPCLAAGESDSMEILETAFFDDDSNSDDTSSVAVKARGDNKGSSSSETTHVRCFGTEEGATCLLHPCQRIKRRLLEVFSIQFFDWRQKTFEGIFGMILLQTSTGPYMLAKRNIDCPNIVDQDVREPLPS